MKISIIITVKNEAASLPALLDSLAGQMLAPAEVVISDGGSTDGTLELLRAEKRLPLTIVTCPGANISQGRNAAIAAASSEIIAVTDAGVRLAPGWLAALTAPWQAQPASSSVAGFFEPDPHTLFEVAMSATVLPALPEINPATFMPSSRSVAFTKAAWQAVGGYPAWLDYCEDLVFDFALRDKFGPFVFAPQAVVYFRPRGSLRAFFRQYYFYARGDGKAGLFFRRHLIRYLTYLLAGPLILAAGIAGSPVWWALYLLAIPFMFATPVRRLIDLGRALPPHEWIQALAWIPVIRVTGDIAKMLGYPVGVLWRWRQRRREESHA